MPLVIFSFQCQSWRDSGYDSAHVPPGQGWTQDGKEEICLASGDHATVLGVVRGWDRLPADIRSMTAESTENGNDLSGEEREALYAMVEDLELRVDGDLEAEEVDDDELEEGEEGVEEEEEEEEAMEEEEEGLEEEEYDEDYVEGEELYEEDDALVEEEEYDGYGEEEEDF